MVILGHVCAPLTASDLPQIKQETLSSLEGNDHSCDICLGCAEMVAQWCSPGDTQLSDSLLPVLYTQFSSFGNGNTFLSRETFPAGVKSYIFPEKNKSFIWGKFQHLLRKKNFPDNFLPSFLLFSKCYLFKEQNWAERKGKKWLSGRGKQSKELWMGQSHHRQTHTGSWAPGSDKWGLSGLRLLLPFLFCFLQSHKSVFPVDFVCGEFISDK